MSTDLYRHFDSNGNLLYVGISLSTLNRLGQHRDNSHWFNTISSVTIEKYNTRKEALIAEKKAITKEKPLHNTVHNRYRYYSLDYLTIFEDIHQVIIKARSKSECYSVLLGHSEEGEIPGVWEVNIIDPISESEMVDYIDEGYELLLPIEG